MSIARGKNIVHSQRNFRFIEIFCNKSSPEVCEGYFRSTSGALNPGVPARGAVGAVLARHIEHTLGFPKQTQWRSSRLVELALLLCKKIRNKLLEVKRGVSLIEISHHAPPFPFTRLTRVS